MFMKASDIDAPFVALKRSLDARGIAACDLTGPLRRESEKRGQLYLRAGAHWTEEGNAAAADSIAECLRGLGVVATTNGAVAGASPAASGDR